MRGKNFEVVNVEERDDSLFVEVEFDDGSRKGFGFPLEPRFLEEDSEGVPFFVRRIQFLLGSLLERESFKNRLNEVDLSSFKNKKFEAVSVKKGRGKGRPVKLGPNARRELESCPESLCGGLSDEDFEGFGFSKKKIKEIRDKAVGYEKGRKLVVDKK